MPLVIPEVVAPPSPPPEHIPPPRTFVTWTPNGGSERILTWPSDWTLRPGVLGADMPPESFFESELTAGDGSLAQSRRALPREVTLPLVCVTARTLDQVASQRRALMRDFDPRLGDGALTWATPDGGRRTLYARYVSGLDTQTGGRLQARMDVHYDVVLRAVDPYWYGDQIGLLVEATAPAAFFPGPPFTISEDTALGTSTIVVDSDVDTYPEWLITGPATAATLSNVTTGKSLSLTPTLTSGQTLLIKTDPRTLAAQKFTQAGVNVWASVAGQFPELWPLQPGSQTVDMSLSGTTSASSIRLTYRPRYLTA